MLKKSYLVLLILILLTSNVSGITNITDVNNTKIYNYENNSYVDTQYNLDNSDSFRITRVAFDAKTYPYSQNSIFTDSYNNKLKYFLTVNHERDFYIFGVFNVSTIVELNGIIIKTYNNRYPDYLYRQELYTSFDAKKDDHLNGIRLYFNKLNIESSNFNYITSIYFDYQDSQLPKIKNEISASKESLNIVFRLIFEVFNIFASIGNLIGVISDSSLLQVQIYLLAPLTLLDKFIGFIFFIIGFIITKGLIWFVAICEMIMFIFAYGKGKPSIMETLTNFINYNKSYFHSIGTLLTWLYEKLFLALVRLIRGGVS